MSRTDQEFKAEVFRRSEQYRRHRREERRKLMNTTVCVALILGALFFVRPFFAMGGSAEPMEDNVGWVEEPQYSFAEAPAADSPNGAAAGSPGEQIPMVMIDGEIYLETDEYADESRKNSTYDGRITSTVSSNEMPQKNNQSNFGIGYGYQYGTVKGTVEIHKNGKWYIFATEAVHEGY